MVYKRSVHLSFRVWKPEWEESTQSISLEAKEEDLQGYIDYSRVGTQWIFESLPLYFPFFRNYLFKELLPFVNHPFTGSSSIKSALIKYA